ncbi:heat shock protein transcriptional repressor HspR [Jatrophihabitans telluris]|uniref:heat shock protein transcriptional repressor HspR n=1 Tax=Jatrophihabitans telluris TaxID=2038343 RepID=UPI00201C7F00|nr:helix-turn-helix transcriptional regulator [Jatrophihabitans telluris]
MGEPRFDEHAAVFVISVAAELAGMHPQTLRQYDRLGLVSPGRTAGRGRRYSARDIAQLREVQRLSQQEGVNLAGIKRILKLENQVDALRSRLSELEAELVERARLVRAPSMPARRLFSAGREGEIVSVPLGRRGFADPSTSLVVWRPRP